MKTKPFPKVACSVMLAAASLAVVSAPAKAGPVDAQQFITRVQSVTPQCRNFPDAPVVGRVSGIFGGPPSRGVSFVGCFGSIAACQRWIGPVSGQITGRLIQDRCEFRR